MVSTENLRETRIIRSGSLAAILLFIGISYNVLYTNQASALSLDVNLPVGGSALAPITNTVNNVTSGLPVPVNVKNTPSTLGANVDTGTPLKVNANVNLPGALTDTTNALTQPLNSVTQPLADSTAPLTNAANQVTQPLSNLTSPVNQALSNLPRASQQPPRPSTPANQANRDNSNNPPKAAETTDKPAGGAAREDERKNTSPFAGVTSFFASTLPDALRNLASGLVGKPVDTLPAIVSGLILLLTMGAIGGIIYASNSRSVLSFGRIGSINLAKFAENHDIAQIATFVAVTVGFGIVATFLALTSL